MQRDNKRAQIGMVSTEQDKRRINRKEAEEEEKE